MDSYKDINYQSKRYIKYIPLISFLITILFLFLLLYSISSIQDIIVSILIIGTCLITTIYIYFFLESTKVRISNGIITIYPNKINRILKRKEIIIDMKDIKHIRYDFLRLLIYLKDNVDNPYMVENGIQQYDEVYRILFDITDRKNQKELVQLLLSIYGDEIMKRR